MSFDPIQREAKAEMWPYDSLPPVLRQAIASAYQHVPIQPVFIAYHSCGVPAEVLATHIAEKDRKLMEHQRQEIENALAEHDDTE